MVIIKKSFTSQISAQKISLIVIFNKFPNSRNTKEKFEMCRFFGKGQQLQKLLIGLILTVNCKYGKQYLLNMQKIAEFILNFDHSQFH